MTFSKTPPTKPGAYWIRHPAPHTTGVVLLNIVRISTGALVEDYSRLNVEYYGHREWCGPLVPVEEVEKAWNECCLSFDPSYNIWFHSRARRVVEGEEV